MGKSLTPARFPLNICHQHAHLEMRGECAPSPDSPHTGTRTSPGWRNSSRHWVGSPRSGEAAAQNRPTEALGGRPSPAHQMSLTKHKFQDEITKKVKMVTSA